MEDHWLDGLAGAVASEQLSRRELWRCGAKAGFAVAGFGLLSGCGALSKQSPARRTAWRAD